MSTAPILLFDGVCNLCAGAVQFILAHEKENSNVRFASLQSETGKQLLQKYNLNTDNIDSLVFIQNSQAYIYADAALQISRYLRFPYNLALVGHILPKAIRNSLYKWVARHRYAWLGKKDACWLPAPRWASRFLD